MTDIGTGTLTGRSRIVINVLTGWGSYLVFFIAGFLLPHLIDRELGKTMLGMWDFAWSLVNYLALSSIGIASNLNRFVATHRAAGEADKIQEAASTVFVIQCCLATGVLTTSVGIALTLPHWIEVSGEELVTLQWVFFFLGASLATQFLFDTSRGILTGCHRWDLHSMLNAGAYFVAVLTMFWLLLAGYSLIALSVTYLTMQFIQGVVRHFIAMHICPEARFSPGAISMKFARTILVFGGKSILLMISPVIVVQTTYFLVMSALGPALLAVLARPMSLIRHIDSFLARFTNILIPMAGSIGALENKEQLQRFALLSARFGYAFTLPIIAVFCIYGGEVVRIWMGDDYVDEAIIVTLGLGYLLPLSQTAILRVLTGLNLHGKAAILSVAGTLVVYATTYLAIRDEPLSAATFALLVVIPLTLINGMLVPVFACIKMGLPVSRYLREGFLAVTLCGGGTSALLWFLQSTFSPSGLWIFAYLATYTLVTALLYWKYVLTVPMRESVSRIVKPRILGIMVRIGLLQRLLNRYDNTIPVLTVHGVADSSPDDPWTPTWQRCSSERLDELMSVLSRYYRFISLDEMVDMITGKRPLESNCMVITFDDGYENNLSVALPILRKYDAPLGVFISTRMLDDREPYWIDRLDFLLTQLQERKFNIRTDKIDSEIRWVDHEELGLVYRQLREQLLASYDNDYQMIADIEATIEALEEETGTSLLNRFESDKWSRIITRAQLMTLPHDVTVGSHTVNHVRADRVEAEDLETEMSRSKASIEAITGHCHHFCYPQGVFNDHAAKTAETSGYSSAFTGESGTNRVGDNPFKLKRISMPQGTSEGEVLYHLLRNLS